MKLIQIASFLSLLASCTAIAMNTKTSSAAAALQQTPEQAVPTQTLLNRVQEHRRLAGAVWIQLGQDLHGEAAGDEYGFSVSLSADGHVLAIGAPSNTENGVDSGHVRVFEWNGSNWDQRGQDIDGEAVDNGSGYSVSLSSDGGVLAIGAPGNAGNGYLSGHVRVYSWDGTAWDQRGNDIDGEADDNLSGISVSLSDDGSVLAVGAPLNDGVNGNDSGHVRVFKWNDLAWLQRGADIDGVAELAVSGVSVSLSDDGSVLAIGAIGNGENGGNRGHVRVFHWTGTNWEQRGQDINGEEGIDALGYSISLSADGRVLAIGAFASDGANGEDSGKVRVLEWATGNAWVQRGGDIDGENAGDESGESVSLSKDGSVVAIGALFNDGVNGINSGHVRVFAWNGNAWVQRGGDLDGESAGDESGVSVSLSADGNVVAIGAIENAGINGVESGHVRVYALGCPTGLALTGGTCVVPDINECTAVPNFCTRANTVCVNTAGSFTCDCAVGFETKDGSCEDIDECTDGPTTCTAANRVCVNTDGSFTCGDCLPGLELTEGICVANPDGILDDTPDSAASRLHLTTAFVFVAVAVAGCFGLVVLV